MKLRFLILLLPMVAVAELTAHEVTHSRIAGPLDFEGAAEVVRAEYRSGDLVVVAPHWAAEARRALGPAVMPIRDQARPDEARYSRLWEVSIRGARAPESLGQQPDLERRFGRVTLRRYPLTPTAQTVFDFVENLQRAEVVEVSGERRRPCQRRGPRWSCVPRGREQWVGTETISDLDHRPRRCIWAHPLARGKVLRLELSDVPRGATLAGHTATDYVVGRHCEPEPVQFEVEIDGRSVGSLSHRDCDSWNPFSFDVPAGPGTVDVAFLISAADPRDRHFCFQAEMRSPP